MSQTPAPVLPSNFGAQASNCRLHVFTVLVYDVKFTYNDAHSS